MHQDDAFDIVETFLKSDENSAKIVDVVATYIKDHLIKTHFIATDLRQVKKTRGS